ncbi:hypothetical protein GY45DRAFT_1332090 [Cubamyces sp. BRFM 1775]|nr:hypothetical protein GY45DRAFT_1332090 [Cubamyces sp. BRFM 1775]
MSNQVICIGKSIVHRDESIQQQVDVVEIEANSNSKHHIINALRPVNKLPFELLSYIFRILQYHHGEWFDDYDVLWYCVAAVCRYWREVANDSMVLWRRLDLDLDSPLRTGITPRRVDVFLTRPGIPSLSHVGILPEFASGSIERVRRRVMGMQHGAYKRYEHAFEENTVRSLENMAALTEVLEVHGNTIYDNTQDDDLSGFAQCLSPVLELPVDPATFPRLRSLTLVTVALAPHLAPFPALRRLHLAFCVGNLISMSTFLTFLSQCQALEVLTLRTFRPKDDHLPSLIDREAPQRTRSLTPTPLPATLRRVYIEDIAPWTARMLEGMSLPQSTNLSVAMTAGRDPAASIGVWDTPLHTCFPSQRSHIDVLRCADTVRVDIDHSKYRIAARSSTKQSGTVTITADVEGCSGMEYLPDFLADLVGLFRKAPVTDLTIAAAGEVEEHLDEEDWAHFLKFFPRLERLAIAIQIVAKSDGDADPLTPMFEVLSNPTRRGDDVCPALDTLVLHFANEQHEARMLHSIQECLRNRDARGRPVSHIRILLDHDPKSDASHAALRRYNNVFSPCVGTVSCGDASYFYKD